MLLEEEEPLRVATSVGICVVEGAVEIKLVGEQRSPGSQWCFDERAGEHGEF